MACLEKLWSEEFVKHWMNNCLINPSGKREGWMACDYLGEYMIGRFKILACDAQSKIFQLSSEYPRSFDYDLSEIMDTDDGGVQLFSEHSFIHYD